MPVVFFNAETDTSNYPNGYASVDFVANPTIGTGSLADGTYKCVIIKTSDVFTVTPATSDGDMSGKGSSLDLRHTTIIKKEKQAKMKR